MSKQLINRPINQTMNWHSRSFQYFYKYKRKLQFRVLSKLQQQSGYDTAREKRCKDKLNNLKILFFGTDNFSLPSLIALHMHKSYATNSLGTVTSFKSPANSVRLYAEQQRLQLYRWPITPDVCRQYDVGVVVSFGHLIPEQLINEFPYGMINVHASMLPRWRGAAPIIYAIMNGDATTGVSIMKIEPKHFDIGDIVAQRAVRVKEHVLMPDLHAQLAEEGAQLLTEVLNDFPHSLKSAKPQDNKLATFAPKITPAITEVIWSEMTASQLYNRYRALYSFKYLTTQFQNKNVHLIELKLPATTNGKSISKPLPPGSFVYQREPKCLLVHCANGSLIEVHQLRLEGKKTMSAMDFSNGFLKKLNVVDLLFSNKRNR